MSATIPLRVMVLDAWVEVPLEPADTTSIRSLKQDALSTARVTAPPEDFTVKFHGAELRDESRTLVEAGIPARAHLIVLRRRRRPVR